METFKPEVQKSVSFSFLFKRNIQKKNEKDLYFENSSKAGINFASEV